MADMTHLRATPTFQPSTSRHWVAALEDPEVLAGELDPVLARREGAGAVGAQHRGAKIEDVLPLVAEGHRSLQLRLDAVVAGAVGHAHALEADESRARRARLRAGL